MNVTSSSSSSTNETQQFSNHTCRVVDIYMPIDPIIYGAVFYIFIFIIGVFGNLLVIYVLAKEKELRTFTNYLLANLSIADLLVLFICVPIGLHDLFAKERWYFGKLACYLVPYIENCVSLASLLTILFITCDRYYVICKPVSVKSSMTKHRTLKLVILIWLVTIIVNLPFLFMSNYKLYYFNDDCSLGYKCYTKITPLNKYYILFSYFLIYFVVGFVLLYMYLTIYKFLKRSNDFLLSCSINRAEKIRIHNTCRDHNWHELESFSIKSYSHDNLNRVNLQLQMNELSKKSYVPNKKLKLTPSSNLIPSQQMEDQTQTAHRLLTKSTHGNLIFFRKMSNSDETIVINMNNKLGKYVKQRKNIIGMLVTLIVVFYICIFPLRVWNLVLILFSHHTIFLSHVGIREYWYISVTCRILFYLNSSINPILYNWFSKKFRRTFKKVIILPKFFPRLFHSTTNDNINNNK